MTVMTCLLIYVDEISQTLVAAQQRQLAGRQRDRKTTSLARISVLKDDFASFVHPFEI